MAPSSGLPDAAAAAARRNRQRIGGQPWFWTSQSDVANRADKLCARLGVPQRRTLPLPTQVKPKGMWSRTFERLRGYAMAAEAVATAAQVAHWVRLLRRVNRRQRRAEPA
jgi:hypothetical protein